MVVGAAFGMIRVVLLERPACAFASFLDAGAVEPRMTASPRVWFLQKMEGSQISFFRLKTRWAPRILIKGVVTTPYKIYR